MTEHSPPEPTLFELPDLDLIVCRNRGHVITKRVEGDFVDRPVMSIVVLNKFAQTSVPDLYSSVDSRSSNAGAIGSEFAAENFCFVLCKSS